MNHEYKNGEYVDNIHDDDMNHEDKNGEYVDDDIGHILMR